MTKGSSTNTLEHYDDALKGYEKISARQPKQPPVRFMHAWALTTQVKDEMEPLTVAKASRSVH